MAGDVEWISGKKGYVKVRSSVPAIPGVNAYGWLPITDWSFPMKAVFLARNCMRLDAVQGYQDGASGFKSVAPSFKGPWAEEAAPIAVGDTVDLLLGITQDGPLEYSATMHVSQLTPSNTAEDGPMMDVSGDSIGAFDVATIGTDGGLPA